MAMNVITTVDKVQRDAIFADFKENGDEYERQAVKFSGVRKTDTGYETTWSVAHPMPKEGV
jgi:hypothetical protein